MSPPFGFLKRKDPTHLSSMDRDAVSSDGISLADASMLLEEIKAKETKMMLAGLDPIRSSVDTTLNNLGKIVEDLSKENLKADDTKFKSLVENSRRTIVATVMRESSSQFPNPKNLEEAVEFKNRLESLLKRCGDASGSHRRVLNEFMKKHSNKMKGEFETLSSIYKKTNELVSKHEAKIEKCSQCLKIIKNIVAKIQSSQSEQTRIQNLLQENKDEEVIVQKLNIECTRLRDSPEFADAVRTIEEIKRVQNQMEMVKKDVSNRFSNISRAITKYSYGTSKVKFARLEKIGNRPWEIFEEELDPYFELLTELRKELANQKIVLKDSNKVIEYIDDIVNALGSLSANIKSNDETLYRLKSSGATELQAKLHDIELRINKRQDSILKRKTEVNDLKQDVENKSIEMEELSKELEHDMLSITGREYNIKTS
jgi:chromosome segregation ATPase